MCSTTRSRRSSTPWRCWTRPGSPAPTPGPTSTRPGALPAFSVTDSEPPFAAGPGRPGVCYVEPEAADIWPTAAAIQAERDAGAELLLVSGHLGPNMVLSPAPHLRAFKQRLLELGCDIVHGHSAHVFQGIETAGRRLILHDTGDFLDDYAVDGICRNDCSFLFLLEIDAGGVRRAVLRPVELGFAEVNLARGKAFDAICDRMVEQLAAFGTVLERCTDGLELVLPAAGWRRPRSPRKRPRNEGFKSAAGFR